MTISAAKNLMPLILLAFYLPYPICCLLSFSFIRVSCTRKSILCLQRCSRWYGVCASFVFLFLLPIFLQRHFFRVVCFYGTYFILLYRCINVRFFSSSYFLPAPREKCIKLFQFTGVHTWAQPTWIALDKCWQHFYRVDFYLATIKCYFSAEVNN